MTDTRWVDDIFQQKDRAAAEKEREHAYVLEQRRQFLAGCDALLDRIARELEVTVDAFNAQMAKRGPAFLPVTVRIGMDSITLTHASGEASIALNRDAEQFECRGMSVGSHKFTISHRDADPRTWQLHGPIDPRTGFGNPVTNIAKELIGPLLTSIAR